MKKTFAIVLTLVMVLSCCGALFVSAQVKAGSNTFLVTHYNDMSPEGAAVILTEAYAGGGWWIHVAFKPVKGYENTYEVIEISDGTGDGKAVPLTVPSGGFVYGLNSGNNWPQLVKDHPGQYPTHENDPDFTNANVSTMIATAKDWVVGDKIVISGVDISKEEVPTSTPNKKWYEDGYTCTASYAKFDPSSFGDVDETPYEEEIASKVGETKDPDFTLDLQSSVEKNADGKQIVTAVLTVKEIAEGVKMQGLSAILTYDKDCLTLLTGKETSDDNDAKLDWTYLDCCETLPYDSWENLSKEVKDESGAVTGEIAINFVAINPDHVLDDDHKLVLTFQFELAKSYTEGGIYVASDTAASIYAPNDPQSSAYTEYVGQGAYTIAKAQESSDSPSSSDPSDSTTTDPSTAPPTGDMGVIVLAALGLLAVVGAAVVVKVRR